ncbi:MAG: hypothetical protein OXI79_12350 [Gammaproteobacteria bacterium]|nr:hypothetical protein [Gammaproteobacteria bacterium]
MRSALGYEDDWRDTSGHGIAVQVELCLGVSAGEPGWVLDGAKHESLSASGSPCQRRG